MLSRSGIKILDDLTSAPVVKNASLSDTVGKMANEGHATLAEFQGDAASLPPAVKERQHGFLKRQRERERAERAIRLLLKS